MSALADVDVLAPENSTNVRFASEPSGTNVRASVRPGGRTNVRALDAAGRRVEPAGPTTVAPLRLPLPVRLLAAGLRALEAVTPAVAGRAAGRLFLTPPRPARPARERALLRTGRPVDVTTERGERLAAWTWGDEGAPAVVLAHGWGGRGAQLGAFVRPLVARGLRVVAFDQLGHGDSDGRRSSLLAFARGLAEVVRQVGPVEAVVAHSLGAGATVLALACGLPVRRAVLVAPPSRPLRMASRFMEALGLGGDAAAAMRADVARRIGVPWEAVDVLGRARYSPVPLRIYHDRDDAEVPWDEAADLAFAATDATLVTTRGLGHRAIVRDAEVVSDALRFLTR